MVEKKDRSQKVRRGIAGFVQESFGAFFSGEMMVFLLVPWAMATFFISDSLHVDNMQFIILIGFLTSPIIIAPLFLITVLFSGPRQSAKREQEVEDFYKSHMKKPL